MPSETTADVEQLRQYEEAIERLPRPATTAEAQALLALFPEDDDTVFGLAWSLLHHIETAPNWPEGADLNGECWWVRFLHDRAVRGGRIPPP